MATDRDTESSLNDMINRCESSLNAYIANKAEINGDSKLRQNHCDVLHMSYDETILAIARLIEVAKDMRAVVISRDLKAAPRSGKGYSTAAEVRAAILHG